MKPIRSKKDTYTYFVTRSPYDPATFIPSDAVLFSFTSPESANERLKTFPQEGFAKKGLYAGTCANQDVDGWYTSGKFDGKTHDEDILTRRDGSYWGFNLLRGIHYILPTYSYIAYLCAIVESMIQNGADHVALSEMGIWGEVGFEEAFRKEWEDFYHEPWQPFWDDPGLYFKGQHLKNRLIYRQVNEVFRPLREKYPYVKYLIASHSSLAYYPFRNPIGNHDLIASDCVDGIEAQAWSNTLEIPFCYDGRTESRPFLAGYTDYSYWANLIRQFPGKEMYYVTDPKGDGYTNKTLQHCFDYYQHQLVSQLFFPEVYRYCSCEWPDRAYSEGYDQPPITTPDYKVIMNNIISLQGQMFRYREPVATPNRSLRVGAVLLDTSNYQVGGPDNTANNNSFFGLTAGLMYNGLLVDTVPMGEEEDAHDILDEYELLLVSFDLMKPAGPYCTERLARYVKEGGCLIFMNGNTGYEALPESWWCQDGFDFPGMHLLSQLGIAVADRRQTGAEWQVKDPLSPPPVQPVVSLGFGTVNGVIPLAQAEDVVTAFAANCGKGTFYYFGLDPAWFTQRQTGPWLWDIVRVIAAGMGKEIVSRPDISYRRGRVLGFNAIGGFFATPEGRYLDLFDPQLRLITGRHLQKGESVLLWDVADILESDIPRVLYAPGRDPQVREEADKTMVYTDGPTRSFGVIRLYIPEDLQCSRLVATCMADGSDVLASYSIDKDTHTMLVTYHNCVDGVSVELYYRNANLSEEVSEVR